MAKLKKELSLHQLRIITLRRASYRWIFRYQALNKAKVKVDIGYFNNGRIKSILKFKCNKCKELFSRKEVQADHIKEIAGENGFTDWNHYIPALLCEIDSYQILCKQCHKEKTKKYLGKRATNKRKY